MRDDKFNNRSSDQKKTPPSSENFGIGDMSGGTIEGNAQVAGKIENNYYGYILPPENQQTSQPSSNQNETKKKRSGIITSELFVEEEFKRFGFAGRTNEKKILENLLINSQSDDKSQIAVIWGIPGVGKSALAYEFAREHQEKFTGGVYIVRVDKFNHQEHPLKSLARWFAEKKERGFGRDDMRNPSEIVEDCFADGQALLIFDNADLIDDKNKKNINRDYIKQLSKLFPDKNCSIIVTTQAFELLKQSWNIELCEENNFKLEPLVEKDAENFLETIIKNYPDKLEEIQNPDNKRIVDNILNTVGNLPIAIKIIGTTLTTRSWINKSLSEYWQALSNNPQKRLRTERNDVTSGVWNSFYLSVQTLDNEIIKLFACIGACASGNFSLKLINAIAECEDDDAEYYLEELENRSLVSSSSNQRYTMHNLLFLFAQIVLKKEQDLFELSITFKQAKNNHAKYFVELVDCNNLDVNDISRRFYQDLDDFIKACDWLAEPSNFNNDYYKFIFNEAWTQVVNAYRLNQTYIKIIESFLQTAIKKNSLNRYDLVLLKLYRIRFLRNKQLDESVIKSVKEVKNDIDELEDSTKRQICTIRYWKNIAGLYERQRKKRKSHLIKEAEFAINQSIQSLETLDKDLNNETLEKLEHLNWSNYDSYEKASCFRRKGLILQRKAKNLNQEKFFDKSIEIYNESIKTFLKSLELYKRSRTDSVPLLEGHLGEAYLELAKVQQYQINEEAVKTLQEAEKYLLQSFESYNGHKFKNWSSISTVLKNLAETYFQLEDIQQAEKYLIQRYKIEENLDKDVRSYDIYLVKKIIKLYIKNNQINNIVNLSLKVEIDFSFIIRNLERRDRDFKLNNKLKSRCRRIRVEIAKNLDNEQEQVYRLNDLGLILMEQNQFKEAQDNFKSAIDISEKLKDKYAKIVSQTNLGRSYVEQYKKSTIKYRSRKRCGLQDELLQKSEDIFKSISEEIRGLSEKRYHIINLNCLAEIASQRGNLNEAKKYLFQAIKQDQKYRDYKSLIKTLIKLASIYQEYQLWKKESNIRYRIVKLNIINQETNRKLSESLFHLAKALVNSGDLNTATAKIDESSKICEDSNDQVQLCWRIREFIKILEKQDSSIQTSKIIQKYRNLANKYKCNRLRDRGNVKVNKQKSRKAKPKIILKNKKSNLS